MFKCPARSKLKCFHLRLIRYDNLLSFFSPPLSLWLIGNSKVTKKNKININNFYIGRYPIYKKKWGVGWGERTVDDFVSSRTSWRVLFLAFAVGIDPEKLWRQPKEKFEYPLVSIYYCVHNWRATFISLTEPKRGWWKKWVNKPSIENKRGFFQSAGPRVRLISSPFFFLLSLFSFVGFSFFRWIWRCGVYLRVVLYKALPPPFFYDVQPAADNRRT